MDTRDLARLFWSTINTAQDQWCAMVDFFYSDSCMFLSDSWAASVADYSFLLAETAAAAFYVACSCEGVRGLGIYFGCMFWFPRRYGL